MANPDGRRGRTDAVVKTDGWSSLVSGHGDPSWDKNLAAYDLFSPDPLTYQQASDLWRGNDLAPIIVEDIPGEMFREGFTVDGIEDEEQSAALQDELERLSVNSKMTRAAEFERAYGGGAIFPVINDGTTDLATPLNEERIPEVKHLQVFEPCELLPRSFYGDISNAKFGKPEIFSPVPINPGGAHIPHIQIHESRLIIFEGIQVSRRQVSQQYGWGDSILSRVHRVLAEFGFGWSGAASLLREFAQGVTKMDGLMQMLASGQEAAVKQRLAAMMLGKSTLKTLLLDAKDSFERQQTPVSGLPELIDRFWTRLAAAARMPVTRLSGQSPAGLNATGASDTRGWYDQVAAEQKEATPQVRRLVQLIMLSKSGPTKGKVPDRWKVIWTPLWQPSDKEQADARLVQAQVDQVYIQNSVLSPTQVLKARFGGGSYSFDTPVTPEEIEEAEKAEEEAAEAALEAQARMTQEPPPGEESEDEPDPDAPPPTGKPRAREDTVEKRGSSWYVLSEDGSKVLGKYRSKKEAVQRLRQVEYFKREGGNS